MKLNIKRRFKVGTKKGNGDLIETANGQLVFLSDVEKMMTNAALAVKQATEKKKEAVEKANLRLRNSRNSGMPVEDFQKLTEWYDGLKTKPKDFPVEILDAFGGVFDLSEDEEDKEV